MVRLIRSSIESDKRRDNTAADDPAGESFGSIGENQYRRNTFDSLAGRPSLLSVVYSPDSQCGTDGPDISIHFAFFCGRMVAAHQRDVWG
jgi:hypothetical protein